MNYVYGGYIVTAVVLGGYCAYLLGARRRGR
jgi:hypothetical protein